MKHILSVDTDKQTIIISEDRRPYINENKTFKPVIEKTREVVTSSILLQIKDLSQKTIINLHIN